MAPSDDRLIHDDSASDAGDVDTHSEIATTLKQRRTIQKEMFQRWLTNASIEGSLTRKHKSSSGDGKDIADEELSIHSLLAKQGTNIIKNPRQFQQELFERAQKENTIAVLDTGSGKTLIAVLLLRWVIDNELTLRATSKPPKVAFFLVSSVTLVYQQFEVLRTNLDHNVARVCGADGVDNWQKAKWERLLFEHKVIVATADVLHQALAQGFFRMSQINLLVFDEAHHTKKNHAYARIVKDFYIPTELCSRPRIFGMTASPIDAKTDVKQAAIELETLLDSRIATTDDMSFHQSVNRPEESLLAYGPLSPEPLETRLVTEIKARFPEISLFEKKLEVATRITCHLGRWCGDQYLLDALSPRNLSKYERILERDFYYRHGGDGKEAHVTQLDENISLLRQVISYIDQHKTTYEPLLHADLSCKVIELAKYLQIMFERPSQHRCIVFVQARHTARLLDAVFKKIGMTNMRSASLIGANASDSGVNNLTFRQQVMTLLQFRKGDINCLFATSVAEEGLDVPDCNLAIRFDIYSTMIQYVQSRGRARQKHSKFIHMVEQGNLVHQDMVNQVRCQERLMREFCRALPSDRRLTGHEEELEQILAKETNRRVYIDPITGAKLTYGNALSILANFVSAIPVGREDDALHPTYMISSRGSNFIAEVVIPGNDAPLRSAIGLECSKKGLAKRSAAFEACLQLRQKEYMNEYLMPIYQKKLPALRNALLAVDTRKRTAYKMRVKPQAWEKHRGTIPDELWVTVVDFPDGLDKPHRPLAMLTRTSMPHFPDFNIFPDNGTRKLVISKQVCIPLQVGETRVKMLTTFTLRIFKDVFNKVYENEPSLLPYWLAPIITNPAELSTITESNVSPERILDWESIQDVLDHEEYKWRPTDASSTLLDRFLVDKWDGKRRFFTKSIADHLQPLSPVPDNTAPVKLVMQANIQSYSISLWNRSREKEYNQAWNPDQPVIEAIKTSTRRDWLRSPTAKDSETLSRSLAFIIPEPFCISALTADVAASCFAWPSIIHRFESCMIAVDACEAVGVRCNTAMALAAVTKGSNDVGDHSSEQVDTQHGMGDNYERLELLGDTVLKMLTTISTFIEKPLDDEYEYHCTRMGMLCNQNLFKAAVKLGLHEYIRSKAFSRRQWYPAGLTLLEGAVIDKSIKRKQKDLALDEHSLGEKTIADVSEALIGAAFLSHNKPGAWEGAHWDNAVRAVTKLVDNPEGHSMLKWSDYREAYCAPEWQTAEVTASQRDLAEKVEYEHAYHFKWPRLLRSAFLHPSQGTMTERVPNYQRLEFLGDSLLDMAAVTYLFYLHPDKDPHWLTEHKMAMVSNKFLGALCVSIGFHKHLRHSSSMMQHQIQEYATELEEAKSSSSGARDYWTTVTNPPKCIPDILEAYVGAIFIDSEFNYSVVQTFFDTHIRWYFEDMSIYDTYANNHPCTHLENLLLTTYGCQDHRLMASEIPTIESSEKKDVVAVVMIHNEIVSFSRGASGRYARLRAAQEALETIQGMMPGDFRSKYFCTCKERAEAGTLDGLMREGAVGSDCAV
nr:dicer-like protein 1 [Quercus suber]POF16313.1 dicer-like protein 1 [Quercus suber]